MKEWQQKELKDKKRREKLESRISPDHELSGVRHRQPHREKDIPVSWHEGRDGMLHVTPTRIQTGARPGFSIPAEDWERIFGAKDEKPPKSSEEPQGTPEE